MNAFRPALIAGLVVTEVALWQWRMLLAHRGRRVCAMLLGFIGAALQITAITQTVTDLHDAFSIIAYAGGVGFGVLFGIVAGERLTPGRIEVTITSALPGLSERLWSCGWSAIAHQAHTRDGPVMTVHVETERRHEAQLWHDVISSDPQARWVTREVQTTTSSHSKESRLPTGIASSTPTPRTCPLSLSVADDLHHAISGSND